VRPAARLVTRRARAHTDGAIYQKAVRNARKKRRAATPMEHRGLFEVTSISYLPATITTLFFLAASLLLGYIQ
jgi:hypothetical protein